MNLEIIKPYRIDIERTMMRKFWGFTIILILLAILIVSCSSAGSTATPASSPTSSATTVSESPTSASSVTTIDGKALLETRCNRCHSLDLVANQKGTADEWKSFVDNHIQKGVELSSDEETVLVQYLAENFK